MASQKQLVAVVAETMGVPIESVTVIDRYLAEAGLRTRALRGRGQTPMTYQDGAHLIIATAWEANPKDAVSLVTNFGQLQALQVAEDSSIAGDALGATFAEALANSLESVPEHRQQFGTHEDNPDHMSLRVVMRQPHTEADIILQKDGRKRTFQYRQPWDRDRGYVAKGDLSRSAEFSQITLGFVGESIADGFDK